MSNMINGKLHWDYKEYLYVLIGSKLSNNENKGLSSDELKKSNEILDHAIDNLYEDLSVYGTEKVRIPVEDLTPDLPEYYRKLYNLDNLAMTKMLEETGIETDKRLQEYKNEQEK